ncbi:MAG: FtsX-like permease family protein [Candidatus Limnocylindria bacterium]
MAPFRVVLQRSLADWLIVVATWLAILCATTLLAVGVLYGDAVALTGLRQVLDEQPVTETSVVVRMRADAEELPVADQVVRRQSGRILGWTDGELARTIHSGSFTLPAGQAADANADAGSTAITVFGAYEGIEDHTTLADGDWPSAGGDPVEVALSVDAAAEMGLAVGDEIAVASRAGEERIVRARVVCTWQPNDPAEAYWLASPLELDGVEAGASFTTYGPLVVEGADLLEEISRGAMDVSWRTLPEFENLALENVRWMRSDAAALERRIGQELGEGAFFSVETGLPDILGSVGRSLLVSRSGVLLLTIQFVILAAYALVLVAGLLVEQRRIETALLRSRGASAGHVAGMAFLEGLLLVVPAALAAPWIALAALGVLNAVGPLASAGIVIEPRVDALVLLVAAGAGLACLIGLVVPALVSGSGLSNARQALGRQGNRTLAQRMGIDLALVVLAGIGLWQLRQYGAPLTQTVRGTFGLDPLLVAAPAIGLLAGAVLALRIVPLIAEVGERVLGMRRGLVAPFGARQLSRRPLRYTRSALLLMLAAALGTFAAAYTTTWTQSQSDQASYQAPGDLRVEVSSFPDLPLWAFGDAYEAIDGVEAVVPAVREDVDVAGEATAGTLLAVDAPRMESVVDLRSDLAPEGVDRLMERIEPDLDPESLDLVPIPGRPAALVVRLDSSFASAPIRVDGEQTLAAPVPPALRSISLSLALRDARGMIHTFVAQPRLQASAAGQEASVALSELLPNGETTRPAFPLELVAVEVVLSFPPDSRVVGELEVLGIEARADDGSATALDYDGAVTAFPVSDAIFGDSGPTIVRLLPEGLDAFEQRALPILVSRTFADRTAASTGDLLAIGSLTRRTQVEVAGIVDAFPTLDPAEPFAVIDVGGYALARYVRDGSTLFADEWWMSLSDEDAAVAALQGEPYSVDTIISRDERHRELLTDPVALGVMGALGIGSVAALIVATIGFVVSAVVTTRERLAEFALLRAMGLSPGQLSAWLTLENAFLLVVGLVAGIGLGLLLAWLVLPFVTLTQDAGIVVPPVIVEVPWVAIGVVGAVAAVALALSVIVIGGALRRVPVSGVLRSGQE